MKYDLLHIQGQPYVLVPLHDYRGLVSSGDDVDLPEEILNALTAREESAIKILRKFRGMTQAELADKADISRPAPTEIETGKKDGSIRAMRGLAEALDVPFGLLG